MDLIAKLSVSPLCSHTLFSNAPVRPATHNVESSQHLEGLILIMTWKCVSHSLKDDASVISTGL